jgi:hypothetical protein
MNMMAILVGFVLEKGEAEWYWWILFALVVLESEIRPFWRKRI